MQPLDVIITGMHQAAEGILDVDISNVKRNMVPDLYNSFNKMQYDRITSYNVCYTKLLRIVDNECIGAVAVSGMSQEQDEKLAEAIVHTII